MWALLKLGFGLFKTYKYIVMAVALLGVLTTVYMHIRNDGIRDTQLVTYAQTNTAQATKIKNLNARITRQNEAKLKALAEAEEKLKTARALAAEILVKNQEMEMEIGVLKFSILEEMKNDEDYADWAYGVVHPAAWLMLQSAASPGPDS